MDAAITATVGCPTNESQLTHSVHGRSASNPQSTRGGALVPHVTSLRARENSITHAARLKSLADAAGGEILRYLSFGPGWDGYDGIPFSREVVARGFQLIERLVQSFEVAGSAPSEITPGPISDGRIDVEVARGNRRLIATLESESKRVEIWFSEGDASHETLVESNSPDLDRWIHRLTGADRVSVALGPASGRSGSGETLAIDLQGGAAET